MDRTDSDFLLGDVQDWLDAAAVFDRAVRVFSDIVRPVVVNTRAARLAPTNLILLACLERSGRTRVSDVIRQFRQAPSNVTYSLKALGEAGCVTLEKDPENRRAKIVVVTDEGARIARAVRTRCVVHPGAELRSRLKSCLKATEAFEEGIELAAALAEPGSLLRTAPPLRDPLVKDGKVKDAASKQAPAKTAGAAVTASIAPSLIASTSAPSTPNPGVLAGVSSPPTTTPPRSPITRVPLVRAPARPAGRA